MPPSPWGIWPCIHGHTYVSSCFPSTEPQRHSILSHKALETSPTEVKGALPSSYLLQPHPLGHPD